MLRAVAERPRLAVLWTIAIIVVVVVGYLVISGLGGSDDEGNPITQSIEQAADDSADDSALAQAKRQLAASEARREELVKKLAARDRRAVKLGKKVRKLKAK